jgi:hypothetical protein
VLDEGAVVYLGLLWIFATEPLCRRPELWWIIRLTVYKWRGLIVIQLQSRDVVLTDLVQIFLDLFF